LLLSSVGLNLGLDYLPGATMFDPAAGDAADAATASKGVWFDAFITNIDRTAKNANLLWWHKQLYFIDHGASLYFHYNWGDVRAAAVRPVSAIKDHILLSWASRIEAVDRELRSRLDDLAVRQIAAGVPAPWLEGIDGPDPAGYVEYLTIRLRNSGSLMTRCAHMTNSFDYALIRVVPSVEREEFFNTGVILFCPQRRYLSARVYLNREKLKAFLPHWL
jgi:hypothetical protein